MPEAVGRGPVGPGCQANPGAAVESKNRNAPVLERGLRGTGQAQEDISHA